MTEPYPYDRWDPDAAFAARLRQVATQYGIDAASFGDDLRGLTDALVDAARKMPSQKRAEA